LVLLGSGLLNSRSSIEPISPEAFVEAEPFDSVCQTVSFETAEVLAALHHPSDQAGAFESLDVLGCARE